MMWVGDWGIHWLWMVGLWVAVIGLIAWSVALLAPRGSTDSTRTPRTILDERYARGELGDDEYRRRRSELDA